MKRVILIISFGTANLDAYNIIEGFREKVDNSFENIEVKITFTSKVLIKLMKEKNGINIDSVEESLNKLLKGGYDSVIIQPLHIMEGKEFYNLKDSIENYKTVFKEVKVNPTIFKNTGKTIEESILNITECIEENINKEKNILLIGHGSKVSGNNVYDEIEKSLILQGYPNVIVGTLEGDRTKEFILKRLQENNIKSVELMLLLILPGNHITRDIKGKDSWEELLKANGIDVSFNLKSLLEYEEIQNLYLSIIKNNIEK